MAIGIQNFTHRLGNQMWQLAVADALAHRNGDTVAYPNWQYAEYFQGEFTPQPVGIQSTLWVEPSFHYTEIPYTKFMRIQGYFQTPKYFQGAEEVIRQKFMLKEEHIDKVEFMYEELFEENTTCAIHVRRGDYLNHPNHHPVITAEYVKAASAHIPEGTQFLIVSDDPDWCEQNLIFDENYRVMRGGSDIDDLAIQIIADHNIIANSSYSWWGAWLNPNPDKIVVYPERWFGPAYAHYNVQDMFEENWIAA